MQATLHPLQMQGPGPQKLLAQGANYHHGCFYFCALCQFLIFSWPQKFGCFFLVSCPAMSLSYIHRKINSRIFTSRSSSPPSSLTMCWWNASKKVFKHLECMPIILTVQRQRQEDPESVTSLTYTSSCFQNKIKTRSMSSEVHALMVEEKYLFWLLEP